MESPEIPAIADPFRHFAEPVLHVAADGETLEANAAFRELAARCGVPPRLADLFGPAIGQLLGQARRDGRTRALVPVVSGPEPRPMFRVSLARAPGGGSIAALMIDVSDEVEVR